LTLYVEPGEDSAKQLRDLFFALIDPKTPRGQAALFLFAKQPQVSRQSRELIKEHLRSSDLERLLPSWEIELERAPTNPTMGSAEFMDAEIKLLVEASSLLAGEPEDTLPTTKSAASR
jgi:hypothetical protein